MFDDSLLKPSNILILRGDKKYFYQLLVGDFFSYLQIFNSFLSPVKLIPAFYGTFYGLL